MRTKDLLCFVAGIALAGILMNYFALGVSAFVVRKIARDGTVTDVDPTTDPRGVFAHWNIDKFPDRKIPYLINNFGSDDLSPEQVKDGLAYAFSLWERIDNIYLGFRFDGYTPRAGFVDDGKNVISWDESGDVRKLEGAGPQTLALARTSGKDQSTGEIDDADIIFNGGFVESSCDFFDVRIKWILDSARCAGTFIREYQADFLGVAAHEIGHFIGLGHSRDKDALMAAPQKVRTPTADDIAGAKFLYPIPSSINSFSTSPSPPKAKVGFNFTITGNRFDPSSSRVFFKGPGCPNGCPVPEGSISSRSQTRIDGAALLDTGDFTVFVQNNRSGERVTVSNAVSLTIVSSLPTPRLTRLNHLNPICPRCPPIGGDELELELTGRNFDPPSVKMIVSGPGCENGCTVPDGSFSSKSSTRLMFKVRISHGIFYFRVRNGSGPLSNSIRFGVKKPGRPSPRPG